MDLFTLGMIKTLSGGNCSEVNSTLTKQGVSADAKAVGDAIAGFADISYEEWTDVVTKTVAVNNTV